MLTTTEIKYFIDTDRTSLKKQKARKALEYYEGRHDIKDYKVYYVDAKGDVKENENCSNITISHPFFTEIVDQATQYMLSGDDYIVKSDIPELQNELNKYFDDDFIMELSDLITFAKVEGDSYLYRYTDNEGKSRFSFADGMNVIEVPSKYASDNLDHVIYHYHWKVEKGSGREREISKVQVWDNQQTYFYKMIDGLEIVEDDDEPNNPRPHVLYEQNGNKYYETFDNVPFVRLDNCRRRTSDLYIIKDLIDDYDLMACGLSNNLQDVAEGIYVTKGFNGNLDDLIENVKKKKQIAVGENGDFDIKTIDIPYQARVAKMEQDEKNIYRFGMALNTNSIGDGVTNYNLKTKYALLELKCYKLEKQLKRMMKSVINMVLDEINKANKWSYTYNDVWVEFKREVMTNAKDNADIAKVEAETKQVEINTLLALSQELDNETLMKNICNVLEIDYEDIKGKLPEPTTPEEDNINAYQELKEKMTPPNNE